jgi:hypothetical protein
MQINFRKIGLYAVLGGVVGLGVSYLYGQLGSTCSIMCNPYLATGIGVMFGVLWAPSGGKKTDADI